MKTVLAASAFAFAALFASAPASAEPEPRPSPHAVPVPHPPTPQLPPMARRPAAPLPPDLQWRRYPDAREVQLRNVAAVVRVMPEARADVALAAPASAGPLAAPELRLAGDRLILDGGLARKIHECRERGDGFAVRVDRHGWLAEERLPVLYLRVPEDVRLTVAGAVSMSMAPAESAELAFSACGEADVEKVERAAEIAMSGHALNLRVYDVGAAELSIAGAGEVMLGLVREGLTLSIAGGGDIEALRVDGPIQVAVQGAGDVNIRDGRATNMSVAVMGAGDVNFGGEADRLDVAIFGAGDVRVRRVNGDVSRRIFGAGDITIGR